jgi:hypothetical protein
MRITASTIAMTLFIGVTGAAAQTTPHTENQTAPHVQPQHGGASVRFVPEHGAMLRQHASSQRYAPVHDAGIHAQVGATIPSSVELHPLPDALLGQLPGARQYRYTVIGNRPVVVDPGSHRVVHVGD